MPNKDLKLLNEITDAIDTILPQITTQLQKDSYENVDFEIL